MQSFKKGPDYIDPLWLGAAAGRPCQNLDFNVETPEANLKRFQQAMQGADVGIVEGNMGLYDGLRLDGSDSNAAMAELLGAPVVLVINCRGMTRGIAPLLQGYTGFSDRLDFGGVILNQVGGERHAQKLRGAVEEYTDIQILGVVGKNPELEIDERHLGLMPNNEHRRSREIIGKIAAEIAASIDLDEILRVAERGRPVAAADEMPQVITDLPAVRVGIPRDEAFGFYYAGDLDALRAAGAELCFFNALTDREIPEVDALFIGGGFPEARMEALESNRSMRESINRFIQNNGPVYAECGGLMYLCRSLTWGDKHCKMAAVIPADAVMQDSPQGRGLVSVAETASHPWCREESQLAEIPGHEFHYSRLESIDPGIKYAYEMLRGYGIDGVNDGILYKNLLASYTHMRDVEGNHWARRFVDYVRGCKQRGSDVQGN